MHQLLAHIDHESINQPMTSSAPPFPVFYADNDVSQECTDSGMYHHFDSFGHAHDQYSDSESTISGIALYIAVALMSACGHDF